MDIMMHNKAVQLCAAGTDDTAADKMLGDTIHAFCSNSPSSRLEREFPDQGNIGEYRGEGPIGLPSSKSPKPMICEVSNQLKDLIEVIKTLAADQRQTRDKIEGLGAEVLLRLRSTTVSASCTYFHIMLPLEHDIK